MVLSRLQWQACGPAQSRRQQASRSSRRGPRAGSPRADRTVLDGHGAPGRSRLGRPLHDYAYASKYMHDFEYDFQHVEATP